MTTPISLAVRQARLLALRDAIDAGGTGGGIEFYTGTIPATPETAITTQTLLGTIVLANVSGSIGFADVSGTIYATLTFTCPRINLAVASGVIGWCRFVDHAGTPIVDRQVGLITDSLPVSVNSLTVYLGGELQLISCVIME